MRQFFLETLLRDGDSARIEGDNFRHLGISLRARLGEPVRLVDAAFGAFHGTVSAFSKDSVTVAGLKAQAPEPVKAPICLGLCLCATDAFESALDAAVQLGADEIVPLHSEHSRRMDEKKFPRWQRLLRESCCQSLRARPPELAHPQSLDAFLNLAPPGRRILAWQHAGPGFELMPEEEVTLVVGPEGGFSEAELQQAKARGWEAIYLGPHVLRVPVAVAAGLAALQSMRSR